MIPRTCIFGIRSKTHDAAERFSSECNGRRFGVSVYSCMIRNVAIVALFSVLVPMVSMSEAHADATVATHPPTSVGLRKATEGVRRFRPLRGLMRGVRRAFSHLPLVRIPSIKKFVLAAALVGAAWAATTVLAPVSATGGMVAGVIIGQPLSRMYSNVMDKVGGEVNRAFYAPSDPAAMKEYKRIQAVVEKHKDRYSEIHQKTQAALASTEQWGREIEENCKFRMQPVLLGAAQALERGHLHQASSLIAGVASQLASHYPQIPRDNETLNELGNLLQSVETDRKALQVTHELAVRKTQDNGYLCTTEKEMAIEALGTLLGVDAAQQRVASGSRPGLLTRLANAL